MSSSSKSSFTLLWRDLKERLLGPVGQVTFWAYALVGIGLCGGLAIWFELARYTFQLGGVTTAENLRLAVITYFPAIGCGAAQQLFIAEKQRSYLRSFGYLSAFVFIVLCVLSFLLQAHHPKRSMAVGIIGSLLAVGIWWVANGADRTLYDTDPEAIVGGPTNTPLTGDLNGYNI